MSDLNRLEDETRTETTAPTPAETPTQTATAPADGSEVLPAGASNVSSVAAGTEGIAPRKKRRRGTRGGQRRKKPAGAGGVPGAAAAEENGGDDDEAALAGQEWTEESVDRGLTDEDIAAQAREDAGLVAPPAARPKIGDSRPAPAAAASEYTANGAATDADGAP